MGIHALVPQTAVELQSLCRFYTADTVGAALISFMGNRSPKRAIDLGSGPGCLSAAIGNRWRGCEIVTVDIDARVTSSVGRSSGDHRHIVTDVLDPEFPEMAIAGGRGFDLAVSNPPYGMHGTRRGLREILEAAGLSHVANLQDLTLGAEVLFLGQSLRLARAGGRVGLIVPDSVITGKAAADLRRVLAEQHRIERVVQLPRGSFRKTETQAFLLVLRKEDRRDRPILLQSLSPEGAAYGTIEVDPRCADHRLDHRYHVAMSSCPTRSRTLAEIGATVTRGLLSGGTPGVFHTTLFPAAAGCSVTFMGNANESEPALAGPGDILLARVGRTLQHKVCIVDAGWTAYTDCVYRLRVPEKYRKRVFGFLTSQRGAEMLASCARGTGARMLGKSELLSLPFPT